MAVDVEKIIGDAEERAQDLAELADRMLNTIILGNPPALPDAVQVLNISPLELPIIPTAPQLGDIKIPNDLPKPPKKPTPSPINANFGSAPMSSLGSLPNPVEPSRPAPLAAFNKLPPNITIPSVPQEPESLTIQLPSIRGVQMPQKPSRGGVAFGGMKPSGPGAAPNVSAAYAGAYREASPLMIDAIKAKVSAWLAEMDPSYTSRAASMQAKLAQYMEGGTALAPAVENAIFERSRSKVDAESRRMQGEALKAAARMGFTLPGGAVMSAMLQARQAGADNNAKAAVDIAVMQAEMEQKNMQFAMSMSVDLHKAAENAALAYHQGLITINGQSIQYAVEFMNSLVNLYDLEVKVFNAKLEGYKADANVFEVLIRASMNEIEIYKAEIEGVKAGVQVDEALVRLYESQVKAHQAAIDSYGMHVRALVDVASLEKTKLDVFQAELQSFGMQAQAHAAEWNAYSAAWAGEEAKVKGYMAQTQAFVAQIEAHKAAVSGEAARISALGDSNKAELGVFEAEIRAYGTQAQANASIVASQTAVQDSVLRGYQIASQAAIAAATAAAEKYKAEANVEIAHAGMKSTRDIEAAKMYNASIQAQAQLAISVAQTYASMASAALGGVNALAVGEQQ